MNGDRNVADDDAVADAAQPFCNKPKRQAVKVRNPDNACLLGTCRNRLRNREQRMLLTITIHNTTPGILGSALLRKIVKLSINYRGLHGA